MKKIMLTFLGFLLSYNMNAQCTPVETIDDNFESYSAGNGEPMPTCWAELNSGNLYIGVRNTSGAANSGSKYISIYTLIQNNAEAYIITPKLSTIDGNHKANFYIGANTISGVTYQLGTMSSNSDTNTFTSLGDEISLQTTDYVNVDSGLVPTTTDTYFAIKIKASAHTNIKIDDFKWESEVASITNDECSGAINIPVNNGLSCVKEVSGSTINATASPQADDVVGVPNTDVWFTFTATGNAHRVKMYNVVNQGGGTSTSTDMAYAIYSGNCDNLTFVDEKEFHTQELVLENLTAGETYYIRAYGELDAVQYNNFKLCVTTPFTLTNDECSTSTTISQLPYHQNLDASGATNNSGSISVCSNAMNDGVWYKFTPSSSGNININVVGESWNPQVGVYKGSCNTLECVITKDADSPNQNTEQINNLSVEANTTYYINIGHYWGSTDGPEGVFTIDVTGNIALLSTGEIEREVFTVYPNPAKTEINIRRKNNYNANIYLYDMQGKQVKFSESQKKEDKINVSDLPQGVYILTVEEKGEFQHQKIIIE